MTVHRREFLKRSGVVGAGLAAAGMLPRVGQTSTASAQESIRLTVWKAPHGAGDEQFFQEQFDKFITDWPNVEIEFRSTPWGAWAETYTAAFASDSPPDISYMPNAYFPKFAEAGLLVDFDTLETVDLAAWKPLFDERIWSLGTRGGKVYGLPFLQAGISFVWNKALFAEAGLDPETPPATWDELRSFAAQLTKADGTQWGYGIEDNSTGEMGNYVPVPIVNYGGELTNEDDTEWLATTDGHVQGLQIQVDMILTDKVAPPLGTFAGPEIFTAFADGKIVMILCYSSNLQQLLADRPEFQIGIGMPPAGPANDYSYGGVGYWMIAEKSAHRDEAAALTEFLSSPDVVNAYMTLTGLFPARTDVQPFADDPVQNAFAATQRNFLRAPSLPFDYFGIILPEYESALSGQQSAADAIAISGAIINERIKDGS